jgi:hypothetical protein
MELGGQNIYPTTFAPYVWHLRGKLGVNLPHLPYLPHHPNRPQVASVLQQRCPPPQKKEQRGLFETVSAGLAWSATTSMAAICWWTPRYAVEAAINQ